MYYRKDSAKRLNEGSGRVLARSAEQIHAGTMAVWIATSMASSVECMLYSLYSHTSDSMRMRVPLPIPCLHTMRDCAERVLGV